MKEKPQNYPQFRAQMSETASYAQASAGIGPGEVVMAEQSGSSFAMLLKQERTGARMTQHDLAEAAGLSERAVSDLERGLVGKPRKETVSLLADALGLEGAGRDAFESTARGRGPAASGTGSSGTGSRETGAAAGLVADPRTWLARVVTALDELGVSAARSMVAKW